MFGGTCWFDVDVRDAVLQVLALVLVLVLVLDEKGPLHAQSRAHPCFTPPDSTAHQAS